MSRRSVGLRTPWSGNSQRGVCWSHNWLDATDVGEFPAGTSSLRVFLPPDPPPRARHRRRGYGRVIREGVHWTFRTDPLRDRESSSLNVTGLTVHRETRGFCSRRCPRIVSLENSGPHNSSFTLVMSGSAEERSRPEEVGERREGDPYTRMTRTDINLFLFYFVVQEERDVSSLRVKTPGSLMTCKPLRVFSPTETSGDISSCGRSPRVCRHGRV